jgi:hypothetical protein
VAGEINKFVLWDLDDDPNGNVRHIPIDEHLSKDDVEHAVANATWIGISRSSGFPILMGLTADGRTLTVVI